MAEYIYETACGEHMGKSVDIREAYGEAHDE